MKKSFIKIRSVILVFLTHQIALPLLKIMRKPNEFTYTMEQLKVLPTDTLGFGLYDFLQQRKLPLLKHYTRHDIKHVLLKYDTTDEGEACLQSFMLGNGRVSFPVLATVCYGLITMPEYWKSMRKAFRTGKQCRSFHGWQWNDLMAEKISVLQHKIFTKKTT